MNRVIKVCAAGVALLFVGATGLFAAPRDGYHERRPEMQQGPQMGGRSGGPQGERRAGPGGERGQQMRAPREQLLMGTVKSVDGENGLIVVTDADGNDKNVRVNPLTKVGFAFPMPPMPQPQGQSQGQPPAQGSAGAPAQGGFCPPQGGGRPGMPPMPPQVKLEDLKEGTFVVVSKFETGTETIEAANIKVIPPKPEGEDKPQDPNATGDGAAAPKAE